MKQLSKPVVNCMGPPTTSSPVGLVFDIQRFSLHDGPGIRTSVFLKGCPLRCIWCHNPESHSHQAELSVDIGRCDYPDGLEEICAPRALHVRSGCIEVNRSICSACGMCERAAPVGSIKLMGRRVSVDEVMQIVLRDRDYYAESGGGITLSGGEPMAQFEFARALLHEAKKSGLHTCLDTSGAAPGTYLEDLIFSVDLFLYDYKATDPELHKRLTGTGNAVILRNLDLLYNRGAKVRLRCPLIPGVNDSLENLRGIATLDRRYPNLEGIEILPYHDMGHDKANRIGKEPAMATIPTATTRQKLYWLRQLSAMGSRRAYIKSG